MQKKYWVSLIICLFIIIIPYFFHPFAINLHADISDQFIQIIRLADARFTFSFNYDDLFVNPFVQLIKNHHGFMRQLLILPFFWFLGLVKIPINETSVFFIFFIVGLALTIATSLILSKIIGRKIAFYFFILLLTVPYYIMQIKGGWWQIFSVPLFFASFYYLYDFLFSQKNSSYVRFAILASLYTTSTPSFVFGYLFFLIYIFFFLYSQNGNFLKDLLVFFRNIFKRVWTYLPILTLLFLFFVTYIGYTRFHGEYGVMIRILHKSVLEKNYGLDTILHFFAHGMGLFGYAVFLAMLVATVTMSLRWKKDKNNIFLYSNVLFFFISSLIIMLVGKGSGAYIYEILFSGLIILACALESIKNQWKQVILFILIFVLNYTQTNLYNFGFTPDGLLSKEGWFTPAACESLWCPFHFADPKNLGIKTLGFVVRDYLKIPTVSFVSKYDSYEVKQPEFVFHSTYEQGPSLHIGRRINYTLEDMEKAQTVAVFTKWALMEAPGSVVSEKQEYVHSFISAHPEFKKVAIITKKELPYIEVYQLDSKLNEKIFPIEKYDMLYDKQYASLEQMAHIDLGA